MSTVFSSSDSKNKENSPFSKDRPFLGKILSRHLLNKPGSSKKTYHVTLDISGSNLIYQEGDAVAIYPSNPNYLVQQLMAVLSATEQTLVRLKRKDEAKDLPLVEYLTNYANLTRVSPSLFDLLKNFSLCPECKSYFEFLSSAEQKETRLDFLQSHDVISIVKLAKGLSCGPQKFVETLSPLLPRFYSIASSQALNPKSIDLLVATFSYEVHGEQRVGIASEFLSTLACNNTLIPLYIHSNLNFKLPEDIKTPIIMIGPGTGLAPFRSFLQQRAFVDPSSQNWLFFGERNQSLDFYYEDELKTLEEQKTLKLSLAFSRDQHEKIYVQDKLLEHQEELWCWISQGSYIYICGDAKNMAKDVLMAFGKIFSCQGNMSEQDAKSYIAELKKTKRLQMDVY
jgi:sulfite reductase (NADPH) flavoprotein alpha-component